LSSRKGWGQQLIEVARADFNGDGIEDNLLFAYCYATHGTLGFGGVTIITRTGPDRVFERIEACRTYAVVKCVPNDLSEANINKCVAIITNGEAVDPESAAREFPRASALAVVRSDGNIVGVGAIKRIRTGDAAAVAEKSLAREVAIKVLPETFARDADRLLACDSSGRWNSLWHIS
jgi:hypothetical protein